jgi:hypothetical protein
MGDRPDFPTMEQVEKADHEQRSLVSLPAIRGHEGAKKHHGSPCATLQRKRRNDSGPLGKIGYGGV